ncbi:MAG: hypothetical protein J4F43_03765 [Dehalococcoidia bacterium]|nr:hypothetical protein [Dehalococcoidia bacterium]
MAGEIDVVQKCGVCNEQVGSFSVKQENMMLSSRARVWCPSCQDNTPELRELAGRVESIQREVDSLPPAGSS